MIGVSERTLRRAVERGEIEAYKLLGNTRVKLPSLHLFVQRARSVPLKLLPPTQAQGLVVAQIARITHHPPLWSEGDGARARK